MPSLHSTSSSHDNESLSVANQQSDGKKTMPAVPAYQSSEAPIQMAVSHSASYMPVGNEVTQIANLDAQVAVAETAATNIVTHAPVGHIHTPTQAYYMAQPSARAWGYCVEEQLKPLAINLGWGTQHVLTNSRPDFHKVVGGNEVFADLTSVNQAGGGGNHITYKLDISAPQGQGRPATWKAADITHLSTNPLGGGAAIPPIQNNGLVTVLHTQTFQDYHNFLNNMHGNYTPQMQNLLNFYGPVSHATFSQKWNQAKRDQFVNLAQQHNDESSEDFTEHSDHDEPENNNMDVVNNYDSGDDSGDYVDNGRDEYSDDYSF